MNNKIKRIIIFFLLFSAAISVLPALPVNGDDLEVKIAIAGPDTPLYFWWGHLALVICNTRTNENNFYDYGVFSFNKEDFYYDFAFGRLNYTSMKTPMEYNIATYTENNRDVTLYTLDLPPEKKLNVLIEAEVSIGSEYLYHHFYNNCVTRVLELIDDATEGQFKQHFQNIPGRYTLRQHVRRFTWFSPFIDWILNFWMGQRIDLSTSVWDEMYLPSEVGRQIVDFEYTDADGNIRKLVSDVEILNTAQGRHGILEAPLPQWVIEFAFSIVLSIALGFLFFMQKKFPALGQVILGLIQSLLGLAFGIAGTVLLFMVLFTSHDYTFDNINLLFCNPLLLAAFPLGIKYAFSKNYYKRLKPEFMLRLLWFLVFLGVIVSMLIKFSPNYWQDNLTDQMLFLPIALIFSFEPFGLERLIRRIFWRWF